MIRSATKIPIRLFFALGLAACGATAVALRAQSLSGAADSGPALSPVQRRADAPGGFSPEVAVKRMQLAPGLEAKVVAAEPDVRQPITIRFDPQGRMWIIQFLQFPHPAGLKAVSVDRYLRTVYDKVPEPPPRGPKGADRVTIFGRPDADGRRHKIKDFVTGLNIAAGLALGYDGAFVLQPPYLLFYPDKNHDDIPDGPPQVLLSGFGMQDTHAVANNLQFGPDGWLYGAQGSNIWSKVNGIEFNQCIWRYNVRTKVFEQFAEGGGNTWGLDFDSHGNAIAGTNALSVALHQVQGAYYVKNFGKHGPLSNPYSFGYLEHMPVKRFKGGHLTIGGLVYQGGALPARFNGAYIAGNLLMNAVYWHVFHRDGSSFTMELGADDGNFLVSNDSWFRPVDLTTGPDGAIYIADWYDKRSVDVDPRDTWDKTNGRIYQVQSVGAKEAAPFDLRTKSGMELVGLLTDPNEWMVRTARELLAERQDASVYPVLRRQILGGKGKLALESLWTLAAAGGFNDELALRTLDHPNEDVRAWTVRLLGDPGNVSPAIAERLARMAATEPSPVVRNQMACSAKRLPGPEALPIIRQLIHRDEDVDDPMIPLLLWWAVESKAVSDRQAVLALLDSPADWRAPIVRKFLIERLGRRYAAEENAANFNTCARLLAEAPGPEERDLLIQGMAEAFEGRSLDRVPPQFAGILEKLQVEEHPSPMLVRFATRLGSPAGLVLAEGEIGDRSISEKDRVATIEMLGQMAKPSSEEPLLKLLDPAQSIHIQTAALAALQSFSDQQIAARVLALYPEMNLPLRLSARTLLESRPAWALALLQAIDEKKVDIKDLSRATDIPKLAGFQETPIKALVQKHWGKVENDTVGTKLALVRTFEILLERGERDPVAGRKVFLATCGVCHSLFGEGAHIGPDLTGIERKNTRFLLENILEPSLSIMPDYITYNVQLKDGRSLSGFMADANDQAITLRDVAGQLTVLERSQIRSLAASPLSLMPEGLLESLPPQQVRDLFGYLQSSRAPLVYHQ